MGYLTFGLNDLLHLLSESFSRFW